VIGDEHISFTTSKIGSLVDVNQSRYVFINPRETDQTFAGHEVSKLKNSQDLSRIYFTVNIEN